MRLLIAPAFALLLLAAAAPGDEREGRCEIRDGDFVWSEPCWFEPAPPHGITIGWLPDHRFPFGWGGIFITSEDGREGRLRVHLSFGGDVELGPVHRSAARPGCWTGVYTICAEAAR